MSALRLSQSADLFGVADGTARQNTGQKHLSNVSDKNP